MKKMTVAKPKKTKKPPMPKPKKAKKMMKKG